METKQDRRIRSSAKRLGLSVALVLASMLPMADALAGQGISVTGTTGTLWWDDGGWTGSWNYLCFGGIAP